ncbi:MAG: hypothetical protein ABI137_03650 [Antricoccus sp.]
MFYRNDDCGATSFWLSLLRWLCFARSEQLDLPPLAIIVNRVASVGADSQTSRLSPHAAIDSFTYLDPDDFTDAQSIATLERITCGNLPPSRMLRPQIIRVLKPNQRSARPTGGCNCAKKPNTLANADSTRQQAIEADAGERVVTTSQASRVEQ